MKVNKLNKGSLIIYKTDNMFVRFINWSKCHIFGCKDINENYAVIFLPMEIDDLVGEYCDIYNYVGKKKVEIQSDDYEFIVNSDKEYAIKNISDILGIYIAKNISYKDLICLINSSENWVKNTI